MGIHKLPTTASRIQVESKLFLVFCKKVSFEECLESSHNSVTMEAPPTEDSNMEVEQSNNTEVQDVQQENSLNIPSKECVKSDQVQNKESSSNEEVGENSVDNN